MLKVEVISELITPLNISVSIYEIGEVMRYLKRELVFILTIVLGFATVGCETQKKEVDNSEDSLSMEQHNHIVEELRKEYEGRVKENKTEPIMLPKVNSEDRLKGELHYNEVRDIYAYIDEIGFEVIGNVNIFEPNKGETQKLTSFDYDGKQLTVKKLMWYSENQLLVIVGFATGTVTVGGQVYVLNIDNKKLQLIFKSSDREEIMDIVIPDGGSGNYIFPVAQWDDNSIEYDIYNVVYKNHQLQELIDSGDFVTVAQSY